MVKFIILEPKPQICDMGLEETNKLVKYLQSANGIRGENRIGKGKSNKNKPCD